MKMPETIRAQPIPTLVMLQGLPGSGKSTVANALSETYSKQGRNVKIHSSDSLRKELYGDENSQEHNGELFNELHRRMREDLNNGITVIYDATNLSKKNRIAFLNEIKNINCVKTCISMITPFEDCLKMNAQRERKVPEEVIKRMYMNWQPPDYSEGFHIIVFFYNFDKSEPNKWSLDNLLKEMADFNQENKHHSLTLGEHCAKAEEYIRTHYPDNKNLCIAARIHDCGKPFTKTRINARGVEDGDCHYYQHHCVGAYDSVLYLNSDEFELNDIVYISNLIYYHMHPYTAWKQSEKSLNRDKKLLGEKFFEDVCKLHEADVYAH